MLFLKGMNRERLKGMLQRNKKLSEVEGTNDTLEKENRSMKRQLDNLRKKRLGEVKLLKRCYNKIIGGKIDLFLKSKLKKIIGRKKKKCER